MADKVFKIKNPITPILSEVRSLGLKGEGADALEKKVLFNGKDEPQFTAVRVLPGFSAEDGSSREHLHKAIDRILTEAHEMQSADFIEAPDGKRLAVDYSISGEVDGTGKVVPVSPATLIRWLLKGMSLSHQGPMNIALRAKADAAAVAAGYKAPPTSGKTPKVSSKLGASTW